MKIEFDEVKVISSKQYKKIIKIEWFVLAAISAWMINTFWIILH